MFLYFDGMRILNLNNVAYTEVEYLSDNKISITIVTTAIYPYDNGLDHFSKKFVINTEREIWNKLLDTIQNDKKLFVF